MFNVISIQFAVQVGVAVPLSLIVYPGLQLVVYVTTPASDTLKEQVPFDGVVQFFAHAAYNVVFAVNVVLPGNAPALVTRWVPVKPFADKSGTCAV